MFRRTRTALVIAVAMLIFACSPEALKRGSYESLHNISDIRNEDDPNYDFGQRPSYEVYKQRREEILRERQPGTDRPVEPVTPESAR